MRPTLLCIDLQRDFLATRELQPCAESIVAAAAALLADARLRGVPVIHVRTTVRRDDDRRLPHWKRAARWSCEAGSAGHAPPAQLVERADELVVHKSGFDPFHDGALDAALRRSGCDTLVLCGVHVHACVRAAALGGLERGLGVRIAADACGSDDPVHAAATRRWLAARCVRFTTLAQAFEPDRSGELDAPGERGADRPTAPSESTPLRLHSPRATDERLDELRDSTPAQCAAAVAAARTASASWRERPLHERCALLRRIAQRVDARADALARQLALEIGKPLSHARDEVCRASANVLAVVRRAEEAPLARRCDAGSVRDEPLGVVAVVSAWNNPVAIPLGKLAPALGFGNAVVWKPAPAATRIAEQLLAACVEAGLPDGLVQIVRGGADTACALAAEPGVDAVTLTGGAVAGHALQELCARRHVPLQAELSGNNAAIVWDCANTARAAERIARGAFELAGQRCTANRRVIVPRTAAASFVAALAAAAERLRHGDPLDARTEIGPLLSAELCAAFEARLARARERGAALELVRTHAAFAREPRFAAGAYAQPAIAVCERAADELVQQESMAPLLVVQPADDFEHALALCNGVRQGLVAALFSDSAECRRRFLAGARAGVLKFGLATAGVDVDLPFGGWKESGIGPPEHGEADRRFYTRLQTVYDAEKA
jgi:acyl-CoA reductase-like NAD-dependent aldehyde dehydrogenase/nicotinamidase-related amidase